jgi:hypothetical protein
VKDVAELIREAERAAGTGLAPGERVLACVRAQPRGAALSAVAGLVVHSLVLRRRRVEAEASGFPVARSMLIALTDRRLLIWRRSGLGRRGGTLLGEVLLTRVAHVSIEGRVGSHNLTFHLVDAPAVTVEVLRRDQPERLAGAFAGLPVSLQASALDAPGALLEEPPAMPDPPSMPEPPPMPAMPAILATPTAPVSWDVPPPPASEPEAAAAPAPAEVPAALAAQGPRGGVALAERPAPPRAPEARPSGACPRCFTKNAAGAAFCWKCLEPLGNGPPARTQPMGLRPAPFAPADALPPPGAIAGALHGGFVAPPGLEERVQIRTPRAWPKVALPVVGALVCLVVVGVFVTRAQRRELSMPAEIIGIQRIDDPSVAAVLDQLSTEARTAGVQPKSALYGYGLNPSLFVVAYDDSSSVSAEDLFRSFAAGFEGPSGRVKLKAMEQAEREGVPYVCAPVTGAAWDTACAWKDGSAVGFVVERGLSVDRFDLAEIVRHDVEH